MASLRPSRRGLLREYRATALWAHFASFSARRLTVLLTGAIILCIVAIKRHTFAWHQAPLVHAPQALLVDAPQALLGDTLIKTHSASESPPPQTYRTSTKVCPSKSVATMKENNSMLSMEGEDEVLLRWFNGLCDGTYIEMGALDGRTFSNSYVFNSEFGWKGLLIEPSPREFAKMEADRPNEIALVNSAVCTEERTVHFVDSKGSVNGIWEFSAPSFREDFWKGMSLLFTQPIPCSPLKDIIAKNIGHSAYFDFFSLDVEGGELEVLLSIDFTKVGFGIILTEEDGRSTRKDTAVRTLLEKKGYKHHGVLSHNGAYYINTNFENIYKDVMYS